MLDLANAHVPIPCHNPLFSYPGLAAPVSPVEPTGGEVGSTQWCRWPAQAWGSVGGDTGENLLFGTRDGLAQVPLMQPLNPWVQGTPSHQPTLHVIDFQALTKHRCRH